MRPTAFLGRTGKALRYNDWRKAHFDKAVEAAGLTDVTPRDLRATHATWVADRHDVMAAAKRLGHSNASATTLHHARVWWTAVMLMWPGRCTRSTRLPPVPTQLRVARQTLRLLIRHVAGTTTMTTVRLGRPHPPDLRLGGPTT
ncbi:tyrosine-type recombinase/integrase [Streptomyces sp. CB01580]|uniref:tyrosine-type recombinase/integrase n=1 Tax=Streptomyces sp. CB01580 TaxID=1703933 RepID=UPI00096272F8|nr:hypothetical protein AMK22_35225 [Streptomyces sp. CB01580]